MTSDARREGILEVITASPDAVSASKLAKHFNVSRQVIVGDVALLRAAGHDIFATARGYVRSISATAGSFVGTVACRHDSESSLQELKLIVGLGAIVVNVSIEHELYGEMTGQLNLRTLADVEAFEKAAKTAKSRMLSELTDGIHLHAISCRDKAHFEAVKQALDKAGYLLRPMDV